MWKIHGSKGAVALGMIVALGTLSGGAHAQENNNVITQNQNGFSLPGVQLPSGHDEVRAADGTTCRSAIAGNGAYLDVGVIGKPEDVGDGSVSSYGRIVIPLSANRKRLDCTKLYDLEVQRLQMELRLMQMGLSRGVTPPSETGPGGEAEEIASSTNEGTQDEDRGFANEADANRKLIEKAKADSAAGDWDEEGWTTDGSS